MRANKGYLLPSRDDLCQIAMRRCVAGLSLCFSANRSTLSEKGWSAAGKNRNIGGAGHFRSRPARSSGRVPRRGWTGRVRDI